MSTGRWHGWVYAVLGRIAMAAGKRLAAPVFVIGTGRSGTTLLVEILHSHRDIVSYPTEANEIWHLAAYPYQRRDLDLPPILFNPSEFTRRSLEGWTPTREETIRRIFTGYFWVWGRGRRLLLKSAMVSFMLEPLVRVFPDARFVHIYRSGPSVVSSLVKKEWPKYRDRVSEADLRLHCARYWNACLTEIHRADRALGLTARGQMFECAYEHLCDDPAAVLRDLSAYLALDPDAYGFDLSTVRSRNATGDHDQDPAWTSSLDAMREAALLKGYVAPVASRSPVFSSQFSVPQRLSDEN